MWKWEGEANEPFWSLGLLSMSERKIYTAPPCSDWSWCLSFILSGVFKQWISYKHSWLYPYMLACHLPAHLSNPGAYAHPHNDRQHIIHFTFTYAFPFEIFQGCTCYLTFKIEICHCSSADGSPPNLFCFSASFISDSAIKLPSLCFKSPKPNGILHHPLTLIPGIPFPKFIYRCTRLGPFGTSALGASGV